MHTSLIIAHKRQDSAGTKLMTMAASNWVYWETCLRQIAIGLTENLEDSQSEIKSLRDLGAEVYQGLEAYEFLLKVVCGLESPVLGETEVQGQFREFFESLTQYPQLYFLLKKLQLDAKSVRAACLQNLGSQSYGSFARKKTRECSRMTMMGGGKLALELLPWLKKMSKPLDMYVRTPEKVAHLVESKIRIADFTSVPESPGALIIAAPISNSFLLDWMGDSLHRSEMILDYRADSHQNPLSVQLPYLHLKDIFSEIESTKSRALAQVNAAKKMISELANKHSISAV